MNKDAFQDMLQDKEVLRKELTEVINRWMERQACIDEPEIAIGMAVGAAAETMADYTASYSFMHKFSDEWSRVCIESNAKLFATTHLFHIKELRRLFGTEDKPSN